MERDFHMMVVDLQNAFAEHSYIGADYSLLKCPQCHYGPKESYEHIEMVYFFLHWLQYIYSSHIYRMSRKCLAKDDTEKVFDCVDMGAVQYNLFVSDIYELNQC